MRPFLGNSGSNLSESIPQQKQIYQVNGMSGGPIMDAFGRVVGMVSGSARTMDGIHLSVLSDELYRATELNAKPAEKPAVK